MAITPQSKVVPERCQPHSSLYYTYFSTVGAKAGYDSAGNYDLNTCELLPPAVNSFAKVKTAAGKAAAEAERQKINAKIRDANYYAQQTLANNLTPPPAPAADPIGGTKAPAGTTLRGSPDSGVATTPAGTTTADTLSSSAILVAVIISAAIYFRR